MTELFAHGDLEGLFGLDAALCDGAAECGLRSFQIMAGALEATGEPFASVLLSYEEPFGVGYAVAAFEIENAPESTEEEAASEIVREEDREIGGAPGGSPAWPPRPGDDPIVALARASVESIVAQGTVFPLPADAPEELTGRRAGAFVSLHEHGQLRGCIGTIAPVRKSLAEEVIRNGVAAATEDPRFAPVRPEELPHLEYSVDVLGEPEAVDNLEQLDPARYGVIVTRGHQRGLLLPDLEGVDTVFDQIAIAKQKAGIRPDEQVHLERFEVVRHTAGGKPRRSVDSREEGLPAAAAGGIVFEDARGHENLVEGAAAFALDNRQFGCQARGEDGAAHDLDEADVLLLNVEESLRHVEKPEGVLRRRAVVAQHEIHHVVVVLAPQDGIRRVVLHETRGRGQGA